MLDETLAMTLEAVGRSFTAEPKEGELWKIIRREAGRIAVVEEALGQFLNSMILSRKDIASALCHVLALRLGNDSMSVGCLEHLVRSVAESDPTFIQAACRDMIAMRRRDPAATSYVTLFLYYKGFHALQWHRVNYWLWVNGRRDLAYFLQSRMSEQFSVDIHPAAQIGSGVIIDHGTGIVIGETTIIGNDVTILHGVTLGSNGKQSGDRHPKIHDRVILCAGAMVLGNIIIGSDAKIGAGSLVLRDVPPGTTAVGVPARVIE